MTYNALFSASRNANIQCTLIWIVAEIHSRDTRYIRSNRHIRIIIDTLDRRVVSRERERAYLHVRRYSNSPTASEYNTTSIVRQSPRR